MIKLYTETNILMWAAYDCTSAQVSRQLLSLSTCHTSIIMAEAKAINMAGGMVAKINTQHVTSTQKGL